MNKKSIGFGCLTILCAVIVLLVAMGMNNVWPLGVNSTLLWDMDIQYIHIYNWYHDVLHGQANIFYDFSKSLGGNMYGVFSTYLASPINLLTYFFSEDCMVYFIAVATIIKISLSGVCCYVYLLKRFKSQEYIALLFSISYAMMEYNVGLCSNLHFLDGIYMLPIVALGVYYLVEYNKKTLLMISVAYTVFCNWYIGYMVCAFVSFYFIFEWLISEKDKSMRLFIQCFGRYLGSVVIGIMAGAITFFPSILASLNGKGEVSFEYLKPDFHCNILEPIKAFFVTSQANVSYEEPAIYVGGLVLMIVMIGILDNRITLKKKACVLIFMAFVFLSFSFVPLEVIWTVFKKAYSFHFRYSFAFSFLLVLSAALFISEIEKTDKQIEKKVLWFGITFLTIMAIGVIVQSNEKLKWNVFYLLYLVIYVFMIYGINIIKKKTVKATVVGIVGLLLMAELCFNATWAFSRYNIRNQEYSEYMDAVGKKIHGILDGDDTFFRMEKTFSARDLRSGNVRAAATEGLSFNYNCITHYSSLYDSVVNDFLTDTGYCKKNAMLTNYVEQNPVMDSILGVKYILTDKECSLLERIDTFSCNTTENIDIYENKYALSFATKISENEIGEKWSNNPMKNQSMIINAMSGKDNRIYIKQEYEETGNGLWKINISEPGPVYAYFCSGHKEREVWVNGNYKETYFGRFYKNILFLGEYQKGDTISLELKDDAECKEDHRLCVYVINEEVYKECFSRLQEKSISPTVFKDNYIEVQWNASENEKVLLSVPYDEGWKIFINNEETSYQMAYNSLVSVNVPAGQNVIVMKYTTPYLGVSIIATIIGMILIVVSNTLEKKKRGIRSDFI